MASSSLIGRIAFDLVANTGKLIAPLKRAEAGIASLASKASKVASIAAPITGLVGSFVSVGFAVSKVTKAFGEIDDIAKQSDRLGFPSYKLFGILHEEVMAGVEYDTLCK